MNVICPKCGKCKKMNFTIIDNKVYYHEPGKTFIHEGWVCCGSIIFFNIYDDEILKDRGDII